MSAILGLVYQDGGEVSSGLAAVQGAMADWGPDGQGQWLEDGVGLAQLTLHNTPESVFEHAPLQSEDGALVLVSSARLDNRAGLCDAFSIPHPERAVTPDNFLILRAYQKWGRNCVHRLLGNWSFAVWDRREKRLFLARDHYGNTGLYYHQGPRVFAFTSSLKGLLSFEDVPRILNEQYLAQLLVIWPRNGMDTFYKEVLYLPPGHCLTLEDGRARVERYWRLEDTPELHLANDDEYAEAFLELFTEAVRTRLRSRRGIASTLSAGLDSGSVTALAARLLRPETLPAFTSVPLADPGMTGALSDEWPLASLTAAWAGNVAHEPIRAEDWSPLDGIRRALEIQGVPQYAAVNAYWIHAILQTMRDRDQGVLLSGQFGNLAASWSGGRHILSLAGRGAWARAGQELIATARQRGSWVRVVGGEVVKPLVSVVFAKLNRLPRTPPWARYGFINPAFAEQLGLLRQMHEAGEFAIAIDMLPLRDQLAGWPATSIGGALWQELGAAYGLEVRDPTTDKRLLEFCLAIPEDQFARNGHRRWLIRRAMEGIMPPAVQWNTRRGAQAADITSRFLAVRDEVETALEDIEAAPRGREYLDLPALRRAWQTMQRDDQAKRTRALGSLLAHGLSVGLFLAGRV